MDDNRVGAEHKAIKFLLVATAVTVAVNVLFLFLPSSFTTMIYGTVQFVWPIISILMLWRIWSSTRDRNTKLISAFLALALVPWTATLVLWEVLLPIFYHNDLAYFVSGFGFMLSYGVILLGLLGLKRSKQWYIHQSTDKLLSVIAIMGVVGVSAFILGNTNWGSARVPDILILLAYLVLDILLLIYCVKLMYMNLRDDLRYLIIIIAEFVFINSIGDLLYELRWVFGAGSVFSIKTILLVGVIYNVSLIFMVAALMLYDSGARKWAMGEVNKNIHRERHLMDDVVMQSPEPMCVCNDLGNITLINDALLELFNMQRSDLVGNFNIFDHLARMDSSLIPHADRLRSGDGIYLSDVSFNRNDGRKYHLSAKLFPIIGPDGAISSYVCIINDITERAQAQKALVDSKREADLYVDLMAHDINNMNQIAMGFLEIAGNTLTSEGKLEVQHAGLIEKPMESMVNSSKLIDNVKKLQKEKSGVLKTRETDLGDVLRDVIRQFESVPGREVTIGFSGPDSCSVMANDLLKEVFINLVGNAIKHSRGPTNVYVILSHSDVGGKRYCKVAIEDTGPGIPDNVKAGIFDRFEPGKPPRGKGLGLYLARTLVEDHHGTISVEDRVIGDYRQGSRFVVLLPV